MLRRRVAVGVGALALLVGAAACTQLPDSGSPQRASSHNERHPPPSLYDPPGPRSGASPVSIVGGYLDAFTANPITTSDARAFVAADDRQHWSPGDGTVIYTDASLRRSSASTVTLTLVQTARLDGRGAYRATRGSSLRRRTISLTHASGQWRIVDPPAVTFVPESFFDSSYESVSLYFLGPERRAGDLSETLVAYPVYLPKSNDLTRRLVDDLTGRPPRGLGADVRSRLGAGDLVSITPPDVSGVIHVALADCVRRLPSSRGAQLRAQLVWSLSQVSGARGVSLSADGQPWSVNPAGKVQSTSTWAHFDPQGSPLTDTVFALRAGRVVAVDGGGVNSFAGTWGERSHAIRSFALTSGRTRVAAVTSSGTGLIEGVAVPTSSSHRLAPVTSLFEAGHDLLDPRWDGDRHVMLVDRDHAGSRLLVVDLHRRVKSVPLGRLSGARIDSFALSPDGSRIAVITTRRVPGHGREPELSVALVDRGPSGGILRIGRAHVLPRASRFASMSSINWRSPTILAVLAAEPGQSQQPYSVQIDGSHLSGGPSSGVPALPFTHPLAMAAAGHGSDSFFVTDARSRLWYLGAQQRWIQLGTSKLSSPTFPH